MTYNNKPTPTHDIFPGHFDPNFDLENKFFSIINREIEKFLDNVKQSEKDICRIHITGWLTEIITNMIVHNPNLSREGKNNHLERVVICLQHDQSELLKGVFDEEGTPDDAVYPTSRSGFLLVKSYKIIDDKHMKLPNEVYQIIKCGENVKGELKEGDWIVARTHIGLDTFYFEDHFPYYLMPEHEAKMVIMDIEDLPKEF